MTLDNLTALFAYFDQLAEQEADDDTLFASSYIRSFIALNASKFGDESQPLSEQLAIEVSQQLSAAKNELSPADQALVNQYWQELAVKFTA